MTLEAAVPPFPAAREDPTRRFVSADCFYCGRYTYRIIPSQRRRKQHKEPRMRTIEHLIPGWSPVRLQLTGLKVIACYACNQRQAHLQALAPKGHTPFSPPLMQGHGAPCSPKSQRMFVQLSRTKTR